MANETFIVDRKLGAVPLSRLLDVRAQLRANAKIGNEISTAGDRPVLTGTQALEPDTLYPSEKNQTLRYYVPRYRLSLDGSGRPAVELRYNAGAGGEVGRLSVTLTWTPPQAAGMEVRAMDHVAALVLRYRIAVQGGGTTAPPAGTAPEQSLALQPLQHMGPQGATSTTIFTDKAQFDTVYQAMKDLIRGTTLELRITARVGVQTWRQVLVGRPAVKDQATVLEKRGVLFTHMLHKESLATLRADPAASAARVTLAAPPPEVATRLEATRAVLAAPQPATPGAPGVAAPAARMRIAAPLILARPVAASPLAHAPMAARVPAPDATRIRRVEGAGPAPARPAAETAAPAADIRLAATRPQIAAATLNRINTPQLSRAVNASDLQVAGRKAVPLDLALDMKQQPAIIDSDLENRQGLPFAFDPRAPENSSVFAVAGFDSGGIHLLLARTIVLPDGSGHTIYQDNLMRDVVHIKPSGFRLDRDSTAPFLPAISFLASEFSTTDNDTDADVLFRVAAVYRLEPWFDPDLVEVARSELARDGLVARFTTAVSHDAKLSLELDFLGDQQSRRNATVDPAAGVNDTLDLDHSTFVRLWRERLAASGGVSGRVDYRLFDGSQAQVPVRLSLWESSSELFDVAFMGPVAEHTGRYRVLVRNRVESPARITDLPGEVVSGGNAHAVDAASVVGQLLQPQETRQIDYDVTGASGPVASFEPTVLGQAEPNLAGLLKLLLVTPGYSALGFSLTVKAAEGAFQPPAGGAEPLTGLLVEFDDGTRANLSPNAGQVEVTLVGRLLDQILGSADNSQRYFYRVTNLHAGGEGARTSWMEGQGTSPLEVSTAIVRLDF